MIISLSFPASVARFMNFQCQLWFGVLNWRGNEEEGTRNWDSAGSDSHFSFEVSWNWKPSPEEADLIWTSLPRMDAKLNKVWIHARDLSRVSSEKYLYLKRVKGRPEYFYDFADRPLSRLNIFVIFTYFDNCYL